MQEAQIGVWGLAIRGKPVREGVQILRSFEQRFHELSFRGRSHNIGKKNCWLFMVTSMFVDSTTQLIALKLSRPSSCVNMNKILVENKPIPDKKNKDILNLCNLLCIEDGSVFWVGLCPCGLWENGKDTRQDQVDVGPACRPGGGKTRTYQLVDQK